MLSKSIINHFAFRTSPCSLLANFSILTVVLFANVLICEPKLSAMTFFKTTLSDADYHIKQNVSYF